MNLFTPRCVHLEGGLLLIAAGQRNCPILSCPDRGTRGAGGAVGSAPRTGPWALHTRPVWDSAFPVDALFQQGVSSVYPVRGVAWAWPRNEGLGEWTERQESLNPGSREAAGSGKARSGTQTRLLSSWSIFRVF